MNDTQRQKWSKAIDINVTHGTNQQRLTLLSEIISTGDHSLLAEYLVDLMVKEDKQDIINGDLDFLDSVLRGDGWRGYSHCLSKENIIEFINRESTHELFFDSDRPEFHHLLAQLESKA